MYQDTIEDEVLSDIQSSASSSRRNSSISSHMATTTNTRSRRESITGRQSSIIDSNENKPIPPKILVFKGKCSKIFKSTLEECVEDCILEFQGENPVYIPKSGQSIQKSIGNKQTTNYSLKESNSNLLPSGRSNRRRSSITQFNLPQTNGIRSSQTNSFTFPTAALTATSTTRMRHQLVQPKYSLVENITEETTVPDPTIQEPESELPQISQEETLSPPLNIDTLSQSFSPSHRKLPSAPIQNSYHSRQKNFRLSDLVMRGPEYYAHIFNLPRKSRYTTETISRQRSNIRPEQQDKYTELERIKQDLFHRYLWTQKPQVSCRIRPISTYTRSTTFVL